MALVVLLLAALGAGYRGAAASNLGPGGARIRVGDQVIGPYRVLLTTAPDPASTGTLTIVAALKDPNTGAAVRDASIKATLVGTDGSRLTGELTHANAGNATDYAAHIEIAQAQDYEVTVQIEGPAGPASITFTQNVSAPRSGTTLLLAGLPFFVILLVLAGIWWARAGNRARPETAEEA